MPSCLVFLQEDVSDCEEWKTLCQGTLPTSLLCHLNHLSHFFRTHSFCHSVSLVGRNTQRGWDTDQIYGRIKP